MQTSCYENDQHTPLWKWFVRRLFDFTLNQWIRIIYKMTKLTATHQFNSHTYTDIETQTESNINLVELKYEDNKWINNWMVKKKILTRPSAFLNPSWIFHTNSGPAHAASLLTSKSWAIGLLSNGFCGGAVPLLNFENIVAAGISPLKKKITSNTMYSNVLKMA